MAGGDDDFRDLMRRVHEGSEDAAWQLVGQYGDPIRRAVRRALNARLRSKFDSLDFVQLVWSSFFRDRGRLDRFNHPEELVAFLVTMARNKVTVIGAGNVGATTAQRIAEAGHASTALSAAAEASNGSRVCLSPSGSRW